MLEALSDLKMSAFQAISNSLDIDVSILWLIEDMQAESVILRSLSTDHGRPRTSLLLTGTDVNPS